MPAFVVFATTLSFIETVIVTSRSNSACQRPRVASSGRRPSVMDVFSSVYSVPRTSNGIFEAKPCWGRSAENLRPNCGQQSGIPPWNLSPLL